MIFTTALAVGTTAYGIYQAAKAKKQLSKLQRPQMDIPQEIRDNLTLAQQRAIEGIPEEQRKQFIQNIQRSTSNAVNRSADRRSGLAGMSTLHQQEMDAYGNLFAQDVAARRANESQLMAQREGMGALRLKQFEVNQMQPYRQQYNEARALQGAGIQNIARGAGSYAQQADEGIKQAASLLIGGAGGGAAGAAAGAAKMANPAAGLSQSGFPVPSPDQANIDYQMPQYNLSGQINQQVQYPGLSYAQYTLPPPPQQTTSMNQIYPGDQFNPY